MRGRREPIESTKRASSSFSSNNVTYSLCVAGKDQELMHPTTSLLKAVSRYRRSASGSSFIVSRPSAQVKIFLTRLFHLPRGDLDRVGQEGLTGPAHVPLRGSAHSLETGFPLF